MTGCEPSGNSLGGSTLCAPFVDRLPVTGAAVSMFGGARAETLVCASDGLAAHLEELQYDLGEGPRWDALRTRQPVLVPDARAATPRWPIFGMAVRETDAAALFVFPLTIGALDLGVAELYHKMPGSLSHVDWQEATTLVAATSWDLLRRIATVNSSATDSPLDDSLISRRDIHQATGMVLAQSGASAADALLLLRAHAFAHGKTLRETADEVLQRRLSFEPTSDDSPGYGLK